VNIQFGAILSVVVLYWKRFFQSLDFYFKLIFAFIPSAVLGLLLNDVIDELLESPTTVAVSLLLGGVVLVFIDKLLNPKNEKQKTYWVLVERVPTEDSLEKMRQGLLIEDYQTKPCEVKILDPQPEVPPREPPVRFRKTVQDIWIEMKIVEGKNRQVRKMTAAIGHPCLRLLRIKSGDYELGDLKPGEWREL
jgi:pseudouridine synthase